MQSERVILTYQDYCELPDDRIHYEIHEGELWMTPAPTPGHQDVLGNLYDSLRHHIRERGLGKLYFAPIDCLFSDTTITQPDLVYLAPDRLALITERGIEGAPTLVVEVLSPSTRRTDRLRKFQLYAQFGVAHYWIVDPALRTIDAFTLVTDAFQPSGRVVGDETSSLPPFPELSIVPEAIWTQAASSG